MSMQFWKSEVEHQVQALQFENGGWIGTFVMHFGLEFVVFGWDVNFET